MADANLITIGMPLRVNAISSFQGFALNQTTDKMEIIFQAPEAATVTKLAFRYASRTGTPPTYKISLQGVDSSGNPDGTIKGGGTPASKTFTPPADATWNNTWREQTLDNSYACARGEFLAFVIEYSSGTVDGSNNSTFTITNSMTPGMGFPYAIQNDAGSRTRQANVPAFAYLSSSKTYGCPMVTTLSQSITTTTEAAIKFALTSGIASTFKVVGARFHGSLDVTQTLTMTLYDGGNAGDTTPLQTVTLDTDAARASATNAFFDLYFDEVTLSTLTVGNSYRLSLVVSGGTNSLNGFGVNAVGDWSAWSGGSMFGLSTRTGGNWTDTTTSRPFIDLILADLTGGSSGSGIAGLIGSGGLIR